MRFNVREASKRPVSAVADQREIRDVATVDIAIDRTRPLTLLFDPDQGLDERSRWNSSSFEWGCKLTDASA